MEIRRATIEDLLAIRAEQPAFWGERDLSPLHHPLLVHDFGETAFVVPGADGQVLGYLFGLLTPQRVGYSHLVAVREGHRREGHARALYEEFERVARAHGALALKAFTQPQNDRSVAFHTALGFSAREVPGYVGPGETRTIFWKSLRETAVQAPEDFERPLPGGALMRPVRLEDADAVYTTIDSEREHLARHLRWTADQTLAGTRAYVARCVAERVAGEGLSAVILAAGGRVLGMAGFVGGVSAEDRAAEIGYWLAAGAQGHGTMTAAVAVLIELGFGSFGLNRVEIRATAENERSRAIPERLGFREEGRLRQAYWVDGRLHDDVVYGLLAADPRSRA